MKIVKEKFIERWSFKTLNAGETRIFPGQKKAQSVLSINKIILWMQDWELIQYKRHLIECYMDA